MPKGIAASGKKRKVRPTVEQPADPAMSLIALTQGQVSLVDTEDYVLLSQWNWYAKWNNSTKTFYAYRSKSEGGKSIVVGIHKQVLGIENNEVMVDHRDRNTLDNRKHNLRVCTREQNMANRSIFESNSSGYRGVCRYGEKWQAYLNVDGARRHIGTFESKEEAASAYDNHALVFHGEFANLNFGKDAVSISAST